MIGASRSSIEDKKMAGNLMDNQLHEAEGRPVLYSQEGLKVMQEANKVNGMAMEVDEICMVALSGNHSVISPTLSSNLD